MTALSVWLVSPAQLVVAGPAAVPTPRDWWTAWAWDPAVLLGLIVAAAFYTRGLRTYWGRVGAGRGVRPWQAAGYAGGLAAIVLALVSPLDPLAEALFAAHMVQHLLLLLVAAPLLVLGAPIVPFLWALPRARRHALGRWWRGARGVRAAWRALSQPAVVWLLYAATLWLWHLPGPYQAALASPPVHALEHTTLLASALLFWWTVLHPAHAGRLAYGPGVLYVFTAGVQSGLLGVLLTFARTPWYPAYAASEAAWGLTPLEDQQLAGLLMWVPGSLAHLLAAAGLFVAWLSAAEREARRQEARAEV
ncbi:MAG TPA: cytochrome c oxidase assembly protein [Chloroflexota bacterium]|jgi:cytochrome c oxidase assembly factor CtaG